MLGMMLSLPLRLYVGSGCLYTLGWVIGIGASSGGAVGRAEEEAYWMYAIGLFVVGTVFMFIANKLQYKRGVWFTLQRTLLFGAPMLVGTYVLILAASKFIH